MHKGDRHIHIRGELTDPPRTEAEELVAAQAGLHAAIVAAEALGLAGTSACSAFPDMAK
jgi:hypothetical protein